MPNTTRQSKPLVLSAAITTLVLVSGCSSLNEKLSGDKVDYRTSGAKTVRLDVPPDLSQLPGQSRFTQLQSSSISASSLQRAEAQNAPGAETVVATNVRGGVKMERQGQQRWLVVNQTPEQVWNQVSKFWEEAGFDLVVNKPEIGLMETNWGEARVKIARDGIVRQTLGRVFDALHDSGLRDMYRTRIERTEQGVEIYVHHRGLSEEYEDQRKERTTWRARESDPSLEAEMLSRLMLALGGTQEDAQALKDEAKSQAPTVAPATSNLTSLNAQGNAVTVAVDPDTTWRRVGLVLDRSGFTVENRDRRQGTFDVRLSANDPSVSKPGFFARLFGAQDQSEGQLSRYQVQVSGEGAKSLITVLDEQGKPSQTATAKRIAKQLAEDLN